jgi:hypothetical protein
MLTYFTDREYGPRPQTVDVIQERLWAGLCRLISTGIASGSFGLRFPEQCPDGYGPCGCDELAFRDVLNAEVPLTEPPRVCRRPFGLSYAAMAGASSMA